MEGQGRRLPGHQGGVGRSAVGRSAARGHRPRRRARPGRHRGARRRPRAGRGDGRPPRRRPAPAPPLPLHLPPAAMAIVARAGRLHPPRLRRVGDGVAARRSAGPARRGAGGRPPRGPAGRRLRRLHGLPVRPVRGTGPLADAAAAPRAAGPGRGGRRGRTPGPRPALRHRRRHHHHPSVGAGRGHGRPARPPRHRAHVPGHRGGRAGSRGDDAWRARRRASGPSGSGSGWWSRWCWPWSACSGRTPPPLTVAAGVTVLAGLYSYEDAFVRAGQAVPLS